MAYRGIHSSVCTRGRASWRTGSFYAADSDVVDVADIPITGDNTLLDTIKTPVNDVKLDAISTVKSLADAVKQPDGASYIMCSSCKTAYVMSENEIGKKGIIHTYHLPTNILTYTCVGLRVRCGVCEKEWYQTTERLLKTDGNNILANMTEIKVVELQAAINAQQWPKNPKIDKIGVFIGNLPYTYTEKELGEIFAEYGVTGASLTSHSRARSLAHLITGISLVRDAEQNSKGFAFVEVASQDDADLMIKEMHHYYTDSQRKLTVRIAQPPSKDNVSKGSAGGSGGDRNQGRQPFNNAGGKEFNNAGGKEWKPRK